MRASAIVWPWVGAAAPALFRPGIPRRQWWVLGGATMLLLLVLRWHFGLTLVLGESMAPTFGTGDLLLLNRETYRNADPERGDIVVARQRAGLIVKRVVGLPGEEVELKRGNLYINQRRVAEPYRVEPGTLNIEKGRLAEDRFALLGDNRALPPSLVVHAIVPKDRIVGKVVFSIRWWRSAR